EGEKGAGHGWTPWRQVLRISMEVLVLWMLHALPHGLGVGRQLHGNFGSGRVGDLVGAGLHLLSQGLFIRLMGCLGRWCGGLNVLEVNALLLAISFLGNSVAGSRIRCLVADGQQISSFQIRGFFCRKEGVFGRLMMLSFPFDVADTLLSVQGILSATEREVIRPGAPLAASFKEFVSSATNTLDAHSLGTLGARNLVSMGAIKSRVRMLG
ncbi:unnamed protein product, partial [Discosporangium mesarthrocarpum]